LPVFDVRGGFSGKAAAIVLAAGASTRMGRAKQLLPWSGGPLLAHVLRQTTGARVDPVVVVLGYAAQEVRRRVEPLVEAEEGRLRWVENARFREGGQASSIAEGLKHLPAEVAGALFVLCDQPLVRTEHLDLLLSRWRGLGGKRAVRTIVASSARGRRGAPALFGRRFFPELASLCGDAGGRLVISRFPGAVVDVEVGDEALTDVDWLEEYESLVASHGRRRAQSGGCRPRGGGADRLGLRYKLWLEDEAAGKVFGDGPLAVLEAVERRGSLRRAAMEMGMSYNKAWHLVRKLETALGVRVLESHPGGEGGGGSEVTADARELMNRYRRFRAEAVRGIERAHRRHFEDFRAGRREDGSSDE